MSTGTIFDIQRASFVDGPGIRTVVFFKGCNLRCKWCHNPESWSKEHQLMRYESRCTHCGRCRAVCPNGAIDSNLHVDRNLCRCCGLCAKACLSQATMLCGREASPEDVLKPILEDVDFYGSDGGVTFSGGECMLQLNFLTELLDLCRKKKVNTAVDTAGNVPWSSFEQILPYTNLFLYDVKCGSSALHKELTGVDNVLILENLSRLLTLYPDRIWIRIPVIPNVNALPKEFEIIHDFLSSLPHPAKIELLPYHRLGETKHTSLGDSISFTADVPSKEDMIMYNCIFDDLR